MKKKRWGKIVPIDYNRVSYTPEKCLHSISHDFPKAKAVLVYVLDEDDTSYIRASDSDIRDICYAENIIKNWVNSKVRGD